MDTAYLALRPWAAPGHGRGAIDQVIDDLSVSAGPR
jgi:hypothetical protein